MDIIPFSFLMYFAENYGVLPHAGCSRDCQSTVGRVERSDIIWNSKLTYCYGETLIFPSDRVNDINLTSALNSKNRLKRIMARRALCELKVLNEH